MSFYQREVLSPLSRWPFWFIYAWRDVKRPYGETVFGPLAVTFQIAVWVFVIYSIFKNSLGQEGDYYAVYLAYGYPAFVFFQSCIVGGQTVLKRSSGLISNIKLPFLLFSLRFTTAAAMNLMFSHLILLALLGFGFAPLSAFWVQAALWYLAYFPLGVLITLVAGFMGVFFPNLMVVVGAITRFLFFATPILWYVGAREGFRFLLAQVNPVAHYINLVREPLMGQSISPLSLIVYFGSLGLFGIASYIALKYFSHRVILKL